MKKQIFAFYDLLFYAIVCGPLIVISIVLFFKEIDAGKENTDGYYWHYHPKPKNGGHVFFLFP